MEIILYLLSSSCSGNPWISPSIWEDLQVGSKQYSRQNQFYNSDNEGEDCKLNLSCSYCNNYVFILWLSQWEEYFVVTIAIMI